MKIYGVQDSQNIAARQRLKPLLASLGVANRDDDEMRVFHPCKTAMRADAWRQRRVAHAFQALQSMPMRIQSIPRAHTSIATRGDSPVYERTSRVMRTMNVRALEDLRVHAVSKSRMRVVCSSLHESPYTAMRIPPDGVGVPLTEQLVVIALNTAPRCKPNPCGPVHSRTWLLWHELVRLRLHLVSWRGSNTSGQRAGRSRTSTSLTPPHSPRSNAATS